MLSEARLEIGVKEGSLKRKNMHKINFYLIKSACKIW